MNHYTWDKKMKIVIADTTFYLLFYNDIKDSESLYHILKKYEMYIGKRIKYELKKHIIDDKKFQMLIKNIETDVDFGELLKIFYQFLLKEYPKYIKDISKGEYEAIGISYLLKQNSSLDYLIIDDKYAYTFVMNNLIYIKSNLVRTIRFLFIGSSVDKILDKMYVINILGKIEKEILSGKNPLYLTKDIWNKEIRPTVLKLKGE